MRSHVRGYLVAIAMASVGILATSPVATAGSLLLKGVLVPQVSTPTPTGSGVAWINIDTVARTLKF
jgi:hypothetical protein